ncbi:hypothetical protein J8M21_15935 [Pseudoalteromonas luteoviolacea]|uniref:hypothetical protein n=1 Tax=Pseudoalteromonas luteoviolacea TaxID=43657 RepID=UPI001B3A3D47|nr:hypothetical protein [Pseudoalteromonas luteoviolacea]MBQ4878707.1 hypothetical protein [Pseudoalteromonas luteoviolacea]MBQ4907247.1 hypothetical protein [Pseudoalteromonas luteoviolacea]
MLKLSSAVKIVSLVSVFAATSVFAIEQCTLASPKAAVNFCYQMNAWDIAAIQGNKMQYGPLYGCKQEAERGSIGHALCDEGGVTTKRVLASPEEALANCYSMGYWDIAAIQGNKKQFGPGYGCKQEVYTGGIGHALVKY